MYVNAIYGMAKDLPDMGTSWWRYWIAMVRALNREGMEFADSCLVAAQIALQAARENPLSLVETMEILEHNREMMAKGLFATGDKLTEAAFDQAQDGVRALLASLFQSEGERLPDFARREADVMEAVARFHEEIEKIREEFGFQFATSNYRLAHETDSFLLYQVLPSKSGVEVRNDLKPMILIPPYMLGVHILSFLPGENKSYAHAFANEGIPTYVRVVKDIMTSENVQTMTPDDDCTQTRALCEVLTKAHGKKVTLNGTCQGGYIGLMNILSGTLTEVCDTLITNVAPIDGTHSPAIGGMPNMHHDFLTTTLPNGNKVANGYLLSLGMRFVAIDRETPLIKVLDQASLHRATDLRPGKTVAALYRWLLKERVHLPLAIAQMSTHTFHEPISEDGVLPVQLYGKPLAIPDLARMNVKWHLNYALKDDLVTPPCALAAEPHLSGTGVLEVVPYPAGHVAILTSPYSRRYAVNTEFQGNDGKTYRGPVKFQLDLAA